MSVIFRKSLQMELQNMMNHLSNNKYHKIGLHEVIYELFGIKEEDLIGRSRHQDIVYARFFCFHFIRTKTKLSLAKIGTMYKRDHATIRHGIIQYESLMDEKYGDNRFKEIASKINAKTDHLDITDLIDFDMYIKEEMIN